MKTTFCKLLLLILFCTSELLFAQELFNYHFSTVGKLEINTRRGAPIESRSEYVEATFRVDDTLSLIGKIKGRGSTTWDQPKKPYKIVLSEATSLYDMPADREWVLLAEYLDPSFLRNRLSFLLSNQVRLNYTVRSHYVEVYLNNSYNGLYLLCEQVKTGSGRQTIHPTEGFVIEVSNTDRSYGEEVNFFKTPKLTEYSRGAASPLVFQFREPERMNGKEKRAIRERVLAFEERLYAPDFLTREDNYALQSNRTSFVGYYLVNELSANRDAAFSSSVYIYLNSEGQLALGPVWDFDLAYGGYGRHLGDSTNAVASGWILKNSVWLDRMFDDRKFIDTLKPAWVELSNLIPILEEAVVRQADALSPYVARDFERWKRTYPVASYQQEVEALMQFVRLRARWLGDAIMNL